MIGQSSGGGRVLALEVGPDGALDAGTFRNFLTAAGDLAAPAGVVRWDGTSWSAIGDPDAPFYINGVRDIEITSNGHSSSPRNT